LKTKTIDIVFDNNNRYSISVAENSVADSLCKMLKHLSQVPLRVCALDNPYTLTRDLVTDQITKITDLLSIPLDQSRLTDQQYLNYLHTYFENRIDDRPEWQIYNEAIHSFEMFNRGNQKEKKLSLFYGSKSGPLTRPFRYNEFDNMQLQFAAGDCYIDFNETGKTPYQYWRDGEENNISRLCDLGKPMLRLDFRIKVALDDTDLTPKDTREFSRWFDQYKTQWCQYWDILNWDITQMQGGILVGQINNIKSFREELQTGANPIQLCLQIN